MDADQPVLVVKASLKEANRQAFVVVALLKVANCSTCNQKVTSLSTSTLEELTPTCTVDQEEDYLLIYCLIHNFATKQFRHSLIKNQELMVQAGRYVEPIMRITCSTSINRFSKV